ncbi:PREDICTED: uncharacterized protein LOC104773881 isoform X2 [Camelina sativa]|nr:PREDICTED: uncharacterized protein LOC104773881 isoform X2 [Camelina sativa]
MRGEEFGVHAHSVTIGSFFVRTLFTNIYIRKIQPNYYVWTGHGEKIQPQYQYEAGYENFDYNTYQTVETKWNSNAYMGDMFESQTSGGHVTEGGEHSGEHVGHDNAWELSIYFHYHNPLGSNPRYTAEEIIQRESMEMMKERKIDNRLKDPTQARGSTLNGP